MLDLALVGGVQDEEKAVLPGGDGLARSKAAIVLAEKYLEQDGIPPIVAQALAPQAFSPHQISITKTLDTPISTRLFSKALHQLKRSGVSLIIAALRAQHLLSSATASSLTKRRNAVHEPISSELRAPPRARSGRC